MLATLIFDITVVANINYIQTITLANRGEQRENNANIDTLRIELAASLCI